ncbi:MAG TPA: hypothetical protein VHC70_00625 [Phycisphaerales bacterium]|jgi:hypothetical protein|nr:hypothetical protein [Phycisphaerales bacterium]
MNDASIDSLPNPGNHDARIGEYIRVLVARGAAVTIGHIGQTIVARAVWPSVGHGCFLAGEGKSVAQALADVRTEDERFSGG